MSKLELPAVAGEPGGLASALSCILEPHLQGHAEISGLRRLTGGTSHDSWAFDAHVNGRSFPLILRREFGSEVLDLSLNQECDLIRALEAAGLPVPRLLAAGDAGSQIGTAYAVSERVIGGDLRKQLDDPAVDRPALGRRLAALQARVHATDLRDLPRSFTSVHGSRTIADQVESWSQIAFSGSSSSDVLLLAAIHRLRRDTPAEQGRRLVHGDFKTNNIVGAVTGPFAVIDWEMAHIGDPLEDLAWTMLWTTRFDLVGGLLNPREYIAAYADASGEAVDPHRLAFWELFALVKLAAVFVKSASLGAEGALARPTHAMLLRAMPWIHCQIGARLLDRGATTRQARS